MSSGIGRSKLQPPSSTARSTAANGTASSKLSRPSTISRPATATGATSRLAARPAANSTINRQPWNDSTVTSIPDSDISTIQADETQASNITSSASLGCLSMSRSNTDKSVRNVTTSSSTMNMSKKLTPPRSDNTYNVTKSGSTGTGLDIVKNIEDVIARNKILEEENNVLRSLIHEESDRSEASFDERRILMLKCQIYQLEKQINILSKSLAFRKHAHTESLNTIGVLADAFRSKLANANANMTAASTFSVDRTELTRWTEMAESTRLKLIKSDEPDAYDNDKESLSQPSLLTSTFTKNDSNCQLLDVCSGNLDHINLKQVGALESNLGKLFGKLCRLKECLETNAIDSSANKGKQQVKQQDQKTSMLLPMHRDNLKSQLEECCSMTQNTCERLFDLTLLVPSAPWAATKKSPIDQLTQETLLAKLKSLGLPKSKYPSVEVLLRSYHIASNYHHHMKASELAAKDEELQFYRSCYQVQRDYIQAVMELFKTKYEAFIGELRDNLNVPLRALIDKFWQMKAEATEANLKEFLGYFKHYAKKFDEVITCIEQMPNNDLIGKTFNELLVQLDKEVDRLNAHCQTSVQQLCLNKIDLEQLSRESDQIFGEVISLTPKDSPTEHDSLIPGSAMTNLVDFV